MKVVAICLVKGAMVAVLDQVDHPIKLPIGVTKTPGDVCELIFESGLGVLVGGHGEGKKKEE